MSGLSTDNCNLKKHLYKIGIQMDVSSKITWMRCFCSWLWLQQIFLSDFTDTKIHNKRDEVDM